MKSETENPPAPAIDAAVVLRGGAEIPVRMFADEQRSALVERPVLVRLLSLDEALTLVVLAEDYYGIADLVTGNAAGWSRRMVAPDSVLEIAEKALDINFAYARRLTELRAKHGSLAAAFRNPLSANPSRPVSASSALTPV